MTVWIVNPFDSLPCEGNRPLRFWLMAEALVRAGHDVVYWTADFNHVSKTTRDFGKAEVPCPSATGTVPGIKVVAVHEPPYLRNVGLQRLWAHWRWARNWRKAATRYCRTGDSPHSNGDCPQLPQLIVVSSPPLAICREVERFAKKIEVKVIVDVMDAWPETFERVVPRWALWPLRRLARANYLGADAITTVADDYIDLVRGYGYKNATFRCFHGISMGKVPKDTGTVPSSGMGTVPIKVVYAGSLGRTYDLKTAIAAVGMLDGVTLEIAGRGEQEEALRRLADGGQSPKNRDCVHKFVFKSYLNGKDLADFLAQGDIGLVPMEAASCVGVPYKFADYAAAGLAVASSLGGESGRLLAKYGAGVAYRPGDALSLAEAIRRLIPGLADAKRGSRRMAESEFNAERIYRGYVDFAESLVSARGA